MNSEIELLMDTLKTRYATKVFDADKKIESEKISALLESLVLTPSSINSQPWHVFAVSNQDKKQYLAQAAWAYNQPKFTDADYVFVFCAKTDFSAADVTNIEQSVADVRGIKIDLARVEQMTTYVEAMDNVEKKQWLKKQIYLMLGQFLTSCALLKLDSCPMEGFLVNEMDKLLDLPDKGLTSVITVAVGYRSQDDFNQLQRAPKARLAADKVLTILD